MPVREYITEDELAYIYERIGFQRHPTERYCFERLSDGQMFFHQPIGEEFSAWHILQDIELGSLDNSPDIAGDFAMTLWKEIYQMDLP